MSELAAQGWLGDWAAQFLDPRKRLYWGYLASAFLIALAWMVLLRRERPASAVRKLLSRDIWCSPSARADYAIFLINTILMGSIVPRLLGHAAVAAFCFSLLHGLFEGRASLLPAAPAWAIAAGFTLVLFVLDDLARYVIHRLMHRLPVLWAFHKVHHSATRLNPLTVLRTHPVEGVLFALRGALVQGLCIGVFVYAFGDRVSLVMVLGANAVKLVFNVLGANLRHSEVPIRYWPWLEKIFLSPAQHQVHHSVERRHHDRNFGVVLSCWDRLFGTFHHSEPDQALRYGLGNSVAEPHSLHTLYLAPFRESAMHIARLLVPGSRARPRAPLAQSDQSSKASHSMKPIRTLKFYSVLAVTLASVAAFPPPLLAADMVNIYSARKEELILPLLERFREETGIGFRLVTGKADGLLKRIEIEGEATPADVFITVDAGRLQRAKQAGILQPVENAVIEERIPAHLRDVDNQWFGLSRRARVIFYARDRVDPSELSTYEDLANEKWRGRLCIRSSNNIYNQSLVASMIAHLGEEATEEWARGLVANFARNPAGGDTDQLLALAAGQCDITLVNTYYFGRMLNSSDESERAAGEGIGVFWPNQDGRGAHVNVSGAGITRHTRHLEAAQALLEFLVNDESQAWYAEVNNEYPVVPGAEVSDTLRSFGEFQSDTLNLTVLGENNTAALQLMDRAGWR